MWGLLVGGIIFWSVLLKIISDLPTSGPFIRGIYSEYSLGDMVTAECLSPFSVPPPHLTWYINSDTADTGSISGLKQTLAEMVCRQIFLQILNFVTQESSTPQNRNLSTVNEIKKLSKYFVLTLKFALTSKHLETSDGILRLKCSAEVTCKSTYLHQNTKILTFHHILWIHILDFLEYCSEYQ